MGMEIPLTATFAAFAASFAATFTAFSASSPFAWGSQVLVDGSHGRLLTSAHRLDLGRDLVFKGLLVNMLPNLLQMSVHRSQQVSVGLISCRDAFLSVIVSDILLQSL